MNIAMVIIGAQIMAASSSLVLGTGHGTKTDIFAENFQRRGGVGWGWGGVAEWSLSLEIMCLYFILSGPHTYLHIGNHICIVLPIFLRLCILYITFATQFSENEGGLKAVLNCSENSSVLVP